MPDAAESRQQPRFPTWIEGTLYNLRLRHGQPVILTDISLGGAGVRLSEAIVAPAPREHFILTFEWRLRLCEFDCEIVGQTEGEFTIQVHLRFRDMGWAQSRSLLDLIAHLTEAEWAS